MASTIQVSSLYRNTSDLSIYGCGREERNSRMLYGYNYISILIVVSDF